MADLGLRRAEVISLKWGDVDIMNSFVKVKRGKGGKARSAVIGAMTWRVLLTYRQTLDNPKNELPFFYSRNGAHFPGPGFLQIFRRISNHAGIHVTPPMHSAEPLSSYRYRPARMCFICKPCLGAVV